MAGDVPRVAHRHAVQVGRTPQCVDDLEGAGLLALQPVGVHAVHEGYREALGQVLREFERVVEIALHLQHARPVHQGLGHLPERDLSLRHEHGAREPRLRRVRGGRGARIAGRGADDGLGTLFDRFRDRERHAAILEGAGGVGSVVLQPHLAPGLVGERIGADERGATFTEGDHRRGLAHREPQAILLDHTAPLVRSPGSLIQTTRGVVRAGTHGSSPSTRSTLAIARTAVDSRSSCRVFWRAPSCARWVMRTSVASSPAPSCHTRSIETPL